MSKWISVADRLPVDCEGVLVYTEEYGEMVGHRNSGAPVGEEWWIPGMDKWRGDVSHWMKLPKSPVFTVLVCTCDTVVSDDLLMLREYKSLVEQLTREEWDLRDQLSSRPLTLREAKISRNNA